MLQKSLRFAGVLSVLILGGISYLIVRDEGLGLKVLWSLIVPVAPLIFYFSPNLWVSLCPFSFLQSIPGRLGIPGSRKISEKANRRLEVISWALLFLLVPLRHFLFDHVGLAALIAIAGISAAALVSGFLFSGLAGWCNSLCPVRSVELLYGQFSIEKNRPSHCRTCAGCLQACARKDSPRWSHNNGNYHLSTLFPGFILGFFLVLFESSLLKSYLIIAGLMALSGLLFFAFAKLTSKETSLKVVALGSLVFYYSFTVYYLGQNWNLGGPVTGVLYAVVGLALGIGFLLKSRGVLRDSVRSEGSSRRLFLKAGIGGAASLLGFAPWALASLTRKIHRFENQAQSPGKFQGARGYILGLKKDKSTLLTEIHFDSGATRHRVLPMKAGHSCLLTENLIICIDHHMPDIVVLNSDLELIKKITAPPGFIYGGHGTVLPDGKIMIAMPVRKATGPESVGLLQVYDENMDLIRQVPSGGVHPHEIHLLPGGQQIAVTHYGQIDTSRANWSYTLNVMEPKLTLLDAETLLPIKDVMSPVSWAILSHFDVGGDGQVYAVTNNYWNSSEFNLAHYRNFAHTYGDNDYELTEFEIEGGIAMPLPLIQIDPQSGKCKEIQFKSKQQRRSQSVRTHRKSGVVFATYSYSNSLVILPPGQEPVSLDLAPWGFRNVRGVGEISGTDYMVLCDTRDKVLVFNCLTLQVEREYSLRYARATHIDIKKV